MQKRYVLINNHVRTAELLLVAREKALIRDRDGGADVAMELSRVGGLLRTIRRLERDMIYWFDPSRIVQDELSLPLEKEYYDEASVPQDHRYTK